MNDDQLIEAVRENVEIYDLTHPKYNDTNFKEELWNEIGKQLNQTGISCKTRWNNIRDNYRKSLRKRDPRSKSTASSQRKYKYADQLCFLNAYFQERDCMSYISSVEDRANNDNEDVEEEKHIIDDGDSVNCETVLTSKKRKLGISPGVSPKKKSTDTTVTTLMKYLMEKNKSTETVSKPVDPVDAFVAGIASTLKTFPPYFLNVAKSRIFAVVQELELNLITERPKTVASTHSPPTSPHS